MLRPGSPAYIAFLGALAGVTPLSVDATLPALPHLAAVFGTTADRVQATVSVFVLSFAVGQLLIGPLADRLGRRPVLLGGLMLYTAAGALCPLSESIGTLVFLRGVQGLGAGVARVLVPAIVRDAFEPQRGAEILSVTGIVQALSPLAAPLIGTVAFAVGGWEAIYATLACYGAALLLAAWLGMGESIRRRNPQATSPAVLLRAWRQFCTTRTSLGAALVASATFASVFAFIANSSFVLIDAFGVSRALYGWLLTSTAASFVAGNVANGLLVRRFGPRLVLAGGLALVAAAALGFSLVSFLAQDGVVVALAAMPLALGAGLVFPNATAVAMAPMAGIAGVASSLFGAMIMASGALSAWLAGIAYDGTARPMAACVVFFAAYAVAAHLALVRQRKGAAEGSAAPR